MKSATKPRRPLHWSILIAMIAGVALGLLATATDRQDLIVRWVKPFGTIFVNLLKLIAIPMIVTSLIKGVSDLKDVAQLSRLGGRTVLLYLGTTVFAIVLGLVIVNLARPGELIESSTRQELERNYSAEADRRIELAEQRRDSGPLQPLVDLVPANLFHALTDNLNMLQVIFCVLLFGVAMTMLPPQRIVAVKQLVDGANDVVLKMVELVMMTAPLGVLALLAALVAESPSLQLFRALLGYALCVLGGLAILLLLFYPALVRFGAGMGMRSFQRGIAPAQLVAFSTSSSAATLPVTMERVKDHLGVDEEVSSFVLPIGATVNMDGTALYQGVATVFIAQAFGIALDTVDQATIVLTATLASIGSAAVPSAGMIMLIIVLGSVGVPEAGLALIFAVDRPLDMVRTVANVTSDASVAVVVARSLGKLHAPGQAAAAPD